MMRENNNPNNDYNSNGSFNCETGQGYVDNTNNTNYTSQNYTENNSYRYNSDYTDNNKSYYDNEGRLIEIKTYVDNYARLIEEHGFYDNNGWNVVARYYQEENGRVLEIRSYYENNKEIEAHGQYNSNGEWVTIYHGYYNKQGIWIDIVGKEDEQVPETNARTKGVIVKIIAGVILLILCLGGGYYGYTKYIKNSLKEVDLSEYKVNFVAYGLDGEGKANIDIKEVPKVKDADEKIDEFLRNPDVKYSTQDHLENGAKVEVELSLSETKAKEKGLKVKGKFKQSFTVSGLTKKNDTTIVIEQKQQDKIIPSTSGGGKWNADKSARLAQFMASWGRGMNQYYRSYSSLAEPPQSSGFRKFGYNGALVDFVYSADGSLPNTYNLVAIYDDHEDSFNRRKALTAHLYLFVIYNGQPMVLITEQYEGNPEQTLYFRNTANTDLRNGFASIVNS